MVDNSGTSDQQMLYLREQALLKSGNHKSYQMKYNFFSESYILGDLSLYDGSISIKYHGENAYLKGVHNYQMKLLHPIRDLKLSGTKKGYRSNGAEEEIVNLISLFLNCRFYLASSSCDESFEDTHIFKFHPAEAKQLPFIFEAKQAFNELGTSFAHVERLQEDSQAFYYAISSFSESLRIASIDIQIAYIKLVNAIEALSGSFPLDDSFSKATDEITGKISSLEIEDTFKEELIKYAQDQRKVKMRFISFLKHYTQNSALVKSPDQSSQIYVTSMTLEDHLKAIYDSRSSYLHSGQPLWISHNFNEENGWHLDGSVGQIHDHFECNTPPLPRYFWFACLVREALMNFLISKSAPGRK